MRNKILTSMRTLVIFSVLVCCLVLMSVLYWLFGTQLDEELDSYASLMCRNMNLPGMTDELKRQVMDTASEDVRVTLIAPDGEVLYDSHAEAAEMENHIEREEVQQALLIGAGESSRMSDTLQVQTVYRARLLDNGNVLRISRDRQSVFSLSAELFSFFGLVFICTSIVSVIISNHVTDNIVQPINEIDLIHPENNRVYDELTPLLLRMEHQNRKLDSYMRELEARRMEFETITDNMSEGLIVINSKMEMLSLNGSAVRIFSGEVENLRDIDLAGKSVRLLSRADALNFVAEGALSGNTVSEVIQLSGRYYRLIGNPVRRDDEVTGAVILAMDVNDVYLNEQSRREFTANVSHELKTPITAVMGYAEIMKNGLVPPEHVGEFSGRIYDEALRLKELVESILHLSKLDEQRVLQTEPVQLRELAETAKKHLSHKAEKRGVSIDINGEVQVMGVSEALQEMISNLMDNAIKYNREGGSVTVEMGESEGHPYIQVSDTGIGIEPGYQDRIFERFFRVDKSHSRQVDGTGLGLSIVKHAAAQHNARLEVISAPDKGATFRITF